MKISYDNLTGALYIAILENTKVVESQEVKDGVILDLDINNKLVGIEIFTDLDPKTEEKIKNILV